MTLEEEFEHFKNLHKYCILKQRLIDIFEKQLTELNIPCFLNKQLDNKVDYCIFEIARIGMYDELYELAWNETKQNFS